MEEKGKIPSAIATKCDIRQEEEKLTRISKKRDGEDALKKDAKPKPKIQKIDDTILLKEKKLKSIEPSNPQLKEDYNKHMEMISEEAFKILCVDIPLKIVTLLKLTDITAKPGNFLQPYGLNTPKEAYLISDKQVEEMFVKTYSDPASRSSATSFKEFIKGDKDGQKKLYKYLYETMAEKQYVNRFDSNPLTNQDADECLFQTKPEEEKEKDKGKDDDKEKKKEKEDDKEKEKDKDDDVDLKTLTKIENESKYVKNEASEMRVLLNRVKIFLQLNVPKMEDGNNFGVAIQEEAINLLNRVEESAFNLHDSIFRYYIVRASLRNKILKYPNVLDYQLAISELDKKQWVHLKITRIDLRNNYIVLYDLLQKNWKYILTPKGRNPHSTPDLFVQ